MERRKFLVGVGAAVAILSSAGCATASSADPSPLPATTGDSTRAPAAAPVAALPSSGGAVTPVTFEALSAVTWILTDLQGTTPVGEGGRRPTIGFLEGGRVAGGASCNRFTGPAVLSADGTVKLGPFATTRMACPPEVATQESAYLAALGRVTALRLEGDDTLVAVVQDGAPLRFRRER